LPCLIDKGHSYDFIIASPQCLDNTYWSKINWFDSLYLDLSSKHWIDKRRIYVTGMSMGGFGTWQVAMDYPDKFAAIVPLCGGCIDSLNICRLNKMPIWTFHGTADTIIIVNEIDRLVARLNKCYGNVRYTRIENEGHFIQYFFENKPEIYK
jgi:predicted peptidase